VVSVDLADARGDVGRGPTCLAHGSLSISELIACISTTQDVSRFSSGVVRAAQCLVGSGHVRRESPNTLRFSCPNGSFLGVRKTSYLVIRQLLCKRLTAALVEGQLLGFLQ
jgi:hypothetical protein